MLLSRLNIATKIDDKTLLIENDELIGFKKQIKLFDLYKNQVI